MDRLSTEQFRSVSGVVARQGVDESENDNSAGPRGLSLVSAAGVREGAQGLTMAPSLVRDLAIRRHTRGWSIKELASRCGIDENFLSDWENGVASPRLDAVERWAAALGVALAIVRAENQARQGLIVDWDKRRITVDGTPIRLTPMEWKALDRLAWTPGELVSHQALFRHLYGDDHHHRAQSTAVRVLITKLRRLIPIRIEARWGQGYVISGIEASLPHAHQADEGVGDKDAAPPPAVAENPCERVALTPMTPLSNPPPIRREPPSPPASPNDAGVQRAVAAPARPSPCRAEELGVIERFLAERGVTRCPDLTTIQQSPLPTLVWDKFKRKWVRPSVASCDAH